MSSTPTSQITRVITSAVNNAPAANISANARYSTTSYLVQGATQGGNDSTLRLEIDKAMVIHGHLQGN